MADPRIPSRRYVVDRDTHVAEPSVTEFLRKRETGGYRTEQVIDKEARAVAYSVASNSSDRSYRKAKAHEHKQNRATRSIRRLVNQVPLDPIAHAARIRKKKAIALGHKKNRKTQEANVKLKDDASESAILPRIQHTVLSNGATRLPDEDFKARLRWIDKNAGRESYDELKRAPVERSTSPTFENHEYPDGEHRTPVGEYGSRSYSFTHEVHKRKSKGRKLYRPSLLNKRY